MIAHRFVHVLMLLRHVPLHYEHVDSFGGFKALNAVVIIMLRAYMCVCVCTQKDLAPSSD